LKQHLKPSVSGGDDVVRIGAPYERFGLGCVVFGDEAVDGGPRVDEWNTPCLGLRRVSLAKNPSTAFRQDDDVGIKWKVQRG
jgi:hypothetical protein